MSPVIRLCYQAQRCTAGCDAVLLVMLCRQSQRCNIVSLVGSLCCKLMYCMSCYAVLPHNVSTIATLFKRLEICTASPACRILPRQGLCHRSRPFAVVPRPKELSCTHTVCCYSQQGGLGMISMLAPKNIAALWPSLKIVLTRSTQLPKVNIF